MKKFNARPMIRVLSALILTSATTATADSLFCAQSGYGTPSATTKHNAQAYRLAQVDLMGPDSIQVDITDNYNDGRFNSVYQAKFSESESLDGSGTISDIPLGIYRTTEEYSAKVKASTTIRKKDGKILLIHADGDSTISQSYECEIPGAESA